MTKDTSRDQQRSRYSIPFCGLGMSMQSVHQRVAEMTLTVKDQPKQKSSRATAHA